MHEDMLMRAHSRLLKSDMRLRRCRAWTCRTRPRPRSSWSRWCGRSQAPSMPRLACRRSRTRSQPERGAASRPGRPGGPPPCCTPLRCSTSLRAGCLRPPPSFLRAGCLPAARPAAAIEGKVRSAHAMRLLVSVQAKSMPQLFVQQGSPSESLTSRDTAVRVSACV